MLEAAWILDSLGSLEGYCSIQLSYGQLHKHCV